ncbi:hypothetical protein M885DRAFT_548618, partial [Pelagophyceae sp. CCMP2097]
SLGETPPTDSMIEQPDDYLVDEYDEPRGDADACEATIALVVGGVRFDVAKEALCRFEDSMLAVMLGRRSNMLQPGTDGAFSLPGIDGAHFADIVAFLETGDASALRERLRQLSDVETASLVQDLDFFGLKPEVFEALDYAGFAPGPGVAVRQRSGSSSCAPSVAVTMQHTPWSLLVCGRARCETLWLDTRSFETQRGPQLRHRHAHGAALHCMHDHCGRRGARRPTGKGSASGQKGSIFVFGGRAHGHSSACTEVLDFEVRKWAEGPPLPQPRQDFAAVSADHDVTLQDGSLERRKRVLVIGGYDSTAPSRRTLATTEWLDVDTMSWSPGPAMPAPRRGHVAVVLQKRKCVLVAGGHDGKSDTKTTWLLDLSDSTWRRGPDLAEARSDATAVMLADESVLVVGGRAGGRRTASTDVLRSETMRFEPGPTLAQGRAGAVVVPVTHAASVSVGGDGRGRSWGALVVGGDGPRRSWAPFMPWADAATRATTEVLTPPGPHRGDDDKAALIYNLRERAARTGGANRCRAWRSAS